MTKKNIDCTYHFSTLHIFFTFLMWRNVFTFRSVMWKISPSDNMTCGEISPHGRFFSTGTARGACDKYQLSSMIIFILYLKNVNSKLRLVKRGGAYLASWSTGLVRCEAPTTLTRTDMCHY